MAPDDTSIRFHCCHSPMREIQVLHDRLLDIFLHDPGLKPADILVMAPDISSYAPAVTGVFGSAPSERFIPWSIADQAGRQEEPLIEGFLDLLKLQESRFTAPDVMALLENQAVLRRFGLTAEDVLLMRSGIPEAGIRWGLDQEQRCEQGLATVQQHTWDFGLDRLLLGYLTGPLAEPWQGIMPCSGTVGNTASWLGGLTDFIRSFQVLRRNMKRLHPPGQWAEMLFAMIDDFLVNDGKQQNAVLFLRQSIADFEEHCRLAGFTRELGLPIIRHWFERRFSEPIGGQAFLAGRVTFCNMVPMRSVPFKVIWLLGMNDLDYPRSQRTPAFDLMAQQPRLGVHQVDRVDAADADARHSRLANDCDSIGRDGDLGPRTRTGPLRTRDGVRLGPDRVDVCGQRGHGSPEPGADPGPAVSSGSLGERTDRNRGGASPRIKSGPGRAPGDQPVGTAHPALPGDAGRAGGTQSARGPKCNSPADDIPEIHRPGQKCAGCG